MVPDREQSRYLTAVMRQGVGDDILVFNGIDGEWRASIIEAGKRGVVLRLDSQVRPQAPTPDVELIIAVVKRGRLEAIVEKAVELGVRSIRLVSTERTNADRARLARLQAIAVEAAEQTGRLDVPPIHEPVKLSALLAGWDSGHALMYCDEGGDCPPALAALALAAGPPRPWSILVGPEGGFSPAERTRLREMPSVAPVSLGPRILRADTAAIAALTLWQAALGDWRD